MNLQWLDDQNLLHIAFHYLLLCPCICLSMSVSLCLSLFFSQVYLTYGLRFPLDMLLRVAASSRILTLCPILSGHLLLVSGCLLISVSCSIGVKKCCGLYKTNGGRGKRVSPLEILEVRALRLAVVSTVRRRFGPLPVSGVCSDLATSSCAPSCRGASADAV